MFITNEDLQTLIDVKEILNDEESDLFCKYNTLIEKLCELRDKKNKINSKRIADKRKENKDYARSKTEIENRLKAQLKKEMLKSE